MSLRDELLKSGLVSPEKAKKLEGGQRKQDHQRKKGSVSAAADEALQQQEAVRQQIAMEEIKKRAHDLALNQSREAEKHVQEQIARAQQLIASHRLNDPHAEIAYHFPDGKHVRRVRVTAQQQRLLARGQLAIVRGDRNTEDFVVVARATALKLQECASDRVLLLYEENNALDADDDWGDWT